MIYLVTLNDTVVIRTEYYKEAAGEYDRCIYYSKPGDIVRLFSQMEESDRWELVRKDWL